MPLGEYLSLDDATVYEFLKACRAADDTTLQTLGSGLLERKLFKAVEASEAQLVNVGSFTAAAMEVLRKSKLDPGYALVADTPVDTPYEPYDPDKEKPATQIYVATTLGEIKEISTQSAAVDQLRKKYTLLRYYYPAALRAKMAKLADDKLKRG
jgi:HD superfamily phosphohydrolase